MPDDPQRPAEPEPHNRGGRKAPAHYARQVAIATELPFALVVPVLLGGAGGYFLDKWLGTSPLFLIGVGLLGLYAGVRELLRRLESFTRKGNGNSNT